MKATINLKFTFIFLSIIIFIILIYRTFRTANKVAEATVEVYKDVKAMKNAYRIYNAVKDESSESKQTETVTETSTSTKNDTLPDLDNEASYSLHVKLRMDQREVCFNPDYANKF